MSVIRVIDEVCSEIIDNMADEYSPCVDATGNIFIPKNLPKLDVFLDDFESALYFNASHIYLLDPAIADYVNKCKVNIETAYQDLKKIRKAWRRMKVKGVIYGKLYNIIYRFMSRCSRRME